MATYNSNEVLKKLRNRGSHAGRVETVSGVLRCAAGTSIATTDLINMLAMGENTRPIAITLAALPVSGTPALTNPTFDVGVIDINGTFTRPDGTTYPAVTTDADMLSAALAITTDNVATDSDLNRPMATAKYAPYYITLTPSGAGAFSVASGDIDLVLTVSFVGEVKGDALVYDEYINDKVAN
jgi:hypothetical protein